MGSSDIDLETDRLAGLFLQERLCGSIFGWSALREFLRLFDQVQGDPEKRSSYRQKALVQLIGHRFIDFKSG